MKKTIIAVALIAGPVFPCFASDLITSTLLDHIMPVTQIKSGETKVALVDSVVQIGKIKGKSIFDIQAGISGDTKPETGEAQAVDFIAGGFLKVSSLIGDKVSFPEHWKFLQALEHGGFANYNFRDEEWLGGYQVGLAFTLNPKQ